MPDPRVSVICIFYNEQRFIAEAIESVLAQEFGDFELLLADDGSADGSTAIARDFAARSSDPKPQRGLEFSVVQPRPMRPTTT